MKNERKRLILFRLSFLQLVRCLKECWQDCPQKRFTQAVHETEPRKMEGEYHEWGAWGAGGGGGVEGAGRAEGVVQGLHYDLLNNFAL